MTAAGHCSDIPYFFHNAELTPLCHQKNYETLDRVMSSSFVNFARTGDPNTDGLPQRDKREVGKTVAMALDDACYIRENIQDELLPLVKRNKPFFKFDFAKPSDDDEEGGTHGSFSGLKAILK